MRWIDDVWGDVWVVLGWLLGDMWLVVRWCVDDLLQAVGCCLSDVGMPSRMSAVILR